MFVAQLTGKRPMGSGQWIVCIWWSLLSVSLPLPMGPYATNLEFPLGSHLRASVLDSKEKNIFCLRNIERIGSFFFFFFLVAYVQNVNSTVFVLPFFSLIQASVQPPKTSPIRLRTCGQSAAQTLEGKTLWRVQMGRSQATVGECHIPARLAVPSVQCLSALTIIIQSYQSLSLAQLPPS